MSSKVESWSILGNMLMISSAVLGNMLMISSAVSAGRGAMIVVCEGRKLLKVCCCRKLT
jgi:hypothetical protein